jgi:hypothetical protein
MRRLLLASLLAAAVMFLWGFLFWTVLMPAPRVFSAPDDSAALSEALVTYLPSSGTYVVPTWEGDEKQMAERFETGPVATIFFRRDGVRMMSPFTFVYGYLQLFVVCFLAAMLLYTTASALPSYGSRVAVVLLLGLAGTLFIELSQPIWWHQPWRFHLLNTLYAVVAWLLAGCVLGMLIKKGRLRF